MTLQQLTPMMRTKELAASVDFYTRHLDFRCDTFSEEWGFAHLSRDNVCLMFAAPNAHETFIIPTFTGSLYLRTNDVNSWWKRLNGKVRMCYPIEDFSYGMREFAIYDNNGYVIQFGQEMVKADKENGELRIIENEPT
jgi:catechol 2,3-dioxygenase-like lactoylglutathione lyase family enzyme